MARKDTLKPQDARKSSLCGTECFKITGVLSSIHCQRDYGSRELKLLDVQGRGPVGNVQERGQQPTASSFTRLLLHQVYQATASASFLCPCCWFPLPPLTLHISLKGEKVSVPVIQSIVSLFPGYVIKQFRLDTSCSIQKKKNVKGKKRKQQQIQYRRYSFTLVQLSAVIFWILN